MKTDIWEMRFTDGRGASFFTYDDVGTEVGTTVARTLRVAALTFESSTLADAHRCLRDGRTLEIVANMAAVAYVLRHEVPDPDSGGR